MFTKGNIGVIGDLHLPFERQDYLNFCVEIFDRCKCKIIVQIGDLVDLHALNFHLRDPDGMSAADEMAEVDKRLKRWIGAFPEMYICLGNHDRLCLRQGQVAGIPSRAMRSFRDMWQFPLGWQDDFSWEFHGVRFMHGTGLSGDRAHIKAAERNRQSTCIGHTHANLCGDYLVSERDRIFGVNCGCGINRHTYAFAYGRDLLKKPALGCAVITDKGRFWQVFAMDL